MPASCPTADMHRGPEAKSAPYHDLHKGGPQGGPYSQTCLQPDVAAAIPIHIAFAKTAAAGILIIALGTHFCARLL